MVALIAPIAALLVGMSFLMVGVGLLTTAIPLASGELGFSDISIGAGSSFHFVGFLIGCILGPYVILRAGHIRAFAAMVSAMSAAALLFPVYQNEIIWLVYRLVVGFCIAGLYLVIESWLNEGTDNKTRGLIMSIYIIALFASLIAGQLISSAVPVTDWAPYVIASVFASLAVLPVTLTRSSQPAPIAVVQFQPRKLYHLSPSAFVCCVLIGMTASSMWLMAPVFATGLGFSTQQAAIYTASYIFGGLVFQWPLGYISDKSDRRRVLLAMGFGLIGICVPFIFLEGYPYWILLLLGMIIGGLAQPAYSVAVAHGFDHAEPGGYVEMSSGLLLFYAVGATIGPLTSSFFMQYMGPGGLFFMVTIVNVAMVLYLIKRISAREAPTILEKDPFTVTAPMGANMIPEEYEESHPDVYVPEAWEYGSDETSEAPEEDVEYPSFSDIMPTFASAEALEEAATEAEEADEAEEAEAGAKDEANAGNEPDDPASSSKSTSTPDEGDANNQRS